MFRQLNQAQNYVLKSVWIGCKVAGKNSISHLILSPVAILSCCYFTLSHSFLQTSIAWLHALKCEMIKKIIKRKTVLQITKSWRRIWSVLGVSFIYYNNDYYWITFFFFFLEISLACRCSIILETQMSRLRFAHEVCSTFFHYEHWKETTVWPRLHVFLISNLIVLSFLRKCKKSVFSILNSFPRPSSNSLLT